MHYVAACGCQHARFVPWYKCKIQIKALQETHKDVIMHDNDGHYEDSQSVTHVVDPYAII